MNRRRDIVVGLLVLAALGAKPAPAHHGWAWTTGENMELTGEVREVRLGNPHGIVLLDVGGTLWTVEVGQPWRNQRAGLADGDLRPGIILTVIGEPSADPRDKRLKAERLILNGRLFNLYPERD